MSAYPDPQRCQGLFRLPPKNPRRLPDGGSRTARRVPLGNALYIEVDERRLTFVAWAPLGPCSTSYSTSSLSLRDLKPSAEIAEKWTKTSGPPFSCSMKPKPFASLNHFTLPLAIFFTLPLSSNMRFPATCRGLPGLRALRMKKAPLSSVFRRESGASIRAFVLLNPYPESGDSVPPPSGFGQPRAVDSPSITPPSPEVNHAATDPGPIPFPARSRDTPTGSPPSTGYRKRHRFRGRRRASVSRSAFAAYRSRNLLRESRDLGRSALARRALGVVREAPRRDPQHLGQGDRRALRGRASHDRRLSEARAGILLEPGF